jgi:hypothetical protein
MHPIWCYLEVFPLQIKLTALTGSSSRWLYDLFKEMENWWAESNCHYKKICGEVLVLGQRDCIVQWDDCIHLLGLLWKLQKWETKIKGCQIDHMIRLGSKTRSRKSGSCQMATESFLSFSKRYQRRTQSWDGFPDTAIGLGKKMFDS